MKYPNAFKGVKKLYTAQILSLIATVALLIAAFAALFMVGAAEAEEVGIGAASLGVAALFGLAAAVLAIIALVMKIVGLNAGAKDEPLFKTALSFAVAGIVVNALNAVLTSEIIQRIASTFAPVAEVLLIYYVVSAIRSLADKLGDSDMVQRAKGVITIVYVTFCVGILAQVLGQFVLTGKVADVVEIVGYVLEIVEFVVYLSYLAKAKKMLSK